MIIDSHAHVVVPPESYKFMAELVASRSNPSFPPKLTDDAVRVAGGDAKDFVPATHDMFLGVLAARKLQEGM